MGRREIFAGNWKMFKTYREAEDLVKGILSGLGDIGSREVVIFPPAVYARDMAKLCMNTQVKVGIQNMYHEKEGAFTGELSPSMVRDCGCAYILIGHSERRHVFGEKDGDVNKKVKAALENGLSPVLCIGELLDDREKGRTREIVKKQLEGGLDRIAAGDLDKIIIAYEPVWAIGTGKVATPEIAEETHLFIREIIGTLYDGKVSQNMPILYGGSVKPDNISGLHVKENIDGALVGGACLKADSFLDIIHVK